MPVATHNGTSTSMRAVAQRSYGPPKALTLTEVEVPAMRERDVLVRVHAAAVNPGDVFSLMGRPYLVRVVTGLLRPRNPVPGIAFSGTVAGLGRRVSTFQTGDKVYGEAPRGAYAEYVAVPAPRLARKPDNLTFEQAAAVPVAGVTALQGLRDKGRIAPGSRLLINGASGGVGTLAVQIGCSLGAVVTAVASTRNVERMRSLGAHHVIDYTQEDFTHRDERYDVVFDLIGNHSLQALRSILTPGGTLVLSSGPPSPTLRRIFTALLWSPFVSQHLRPLLQTSSREGLQSLTEMIEASEVTPILDRVYPLEEAAAALRYQAEGHARGRTVISVRSSQEAATA